MRRAPEVRSPGPGPGAGVERNPERASMLAARIGIVATIVAGQLWGLTVALNEWFAGHTRPVWYLLGFEAVSFSLAFLVWLSAPKEER